MSGRFRACIRMIVVISASFFFASSLTTGCSQKSVSCTNNDDCKKLGPGNVCIGVYPNRFLCRDLNCKTDDDCRNEWNTLFACEQLLCAMPHVCKTDEDCRGNAKCIQNACDHKALKQPREPFVEAGPEPSPDAPPAREEAPQEQAKEIEAKEEAPDAPMGCVPPCEDDTICINRRCVPKPKTCNPPCLPDQLCDDGTCRPITNCTRPSKVFFTNNFPYAKGTKQLADWYSRPVLSISKGNGKFVTMSSTDQVAGSKRGEVLWAKHTITAEEELWVLHLNKKYIYDPSVSGGIQGLRLSYETYDATGRGSAVTSIALYQNDTIYWVGRLFNTSGRWLSYILDMTMIHKGLKKLSGPGPALPDLSAQGAPIRFGILTGASTKSSGNRDYTTLIDNIKVEICTGPTPPWEPISWEPLPEETTADAGTEPIPDQMTDTLPDTIPDTNPREATPSPWACNPNFPKASWTVAPGYRAFLAHKSNVSFSYPTGITFAGSGSNAKLYIATRNKGLFTLDVATGIATSLVDIATWPTPKPTELSSISWDANQVFDGQLYVGDKGNGKDQNSIIYRVTLNGKVSIFTKAPGPGLDDIYTMIFAPLNYPAGLYVAGDTDNSANMTKGMGRYSKLGKRYVFGPYHGIQGMTVDTQGLYGMGKNALFAAFPGAGGFLKGTGSIHYISASGRKYPKPLISGLIGAHAIRIAPPGPFKGQMAVASWDNDKLYLVTPPMSRTPPKLQEIASKLYLEISDANVLAFSPDGRALYVADHNVHRIVCIEPISP